MRCENCGADISTRQKFCTACGVRSPLTCPDCGAPNSPGDMFCGECGAAVSTPIDPAPPSPASEVNRKAATEGQELLEKCALFRALDVSARRQLASHAHRFRFAAGEIIFEAGTPGQSMMAVLVGTVRITARSPRGQKILLADVYAGEVVGEIAMLSGGGRTADAIALTSCELLVLERRDVRPFLQRHPDACLKLMETLCARLRHADEQITEVAFSDLAIRLSKLLLRLSNGAGSKVGTSQGDLATMVGATRESVNRCLRDWQRCGLVRLHEGWITVADEAALAKMSDHV